MTDNFRCLAWGAWFDSFDIHFGFVGLQSTCSNLSRSLIETMKIPMALKALGIVIPVGVTFLDFVGYIARVDGISMQPSLNPVPGQVDFVVLNKWAVRNYDISRGDIISLISPRNPDQKFIKRVVGLEGDVISTTGYKKSIVTVPEGHCWVEGDHIGSSLDSNYFGPVPLGLITAKATHVVWPPSRWCSLQNTKKG